MGVAVCVSLPFEGKVGFVQQNSDEVFKRYMYSYYLISHFVTDSPQGEAKQSNNSKSANILALILNGYCRGGALYPPENSENPKAERHAGRFLRYAI